MRPALVAAALVALLLGAAATARQGVWGNFTATAADAGNSITAATDFRAPSAGATTIAKTAGGLVGQIKKGGTYYVYAEVSDSGNPASGISTVKADVSSITSGSTAVALTAGSYSAGGVSYNYRSSSLTAGSKLTPGGYEYSLTMTDGAGNSATQSGFEVAVVGTGIAGADVQTANGGLIAGRADAGDTIEFTFNDEVDPDSIINNWNREATDVVVRLNNATNDTVTIFNSTNSTQLPLGTVKLGRADYTSSNRTFGASGVPSVMVMTGSTITIVLGTQSGAATTAGATGTMSWTPSATATDAAGNAVSTTAVTESGAADREF